MDNDEYKHIKPLFTGVVSGVVSRTATAPLERLKILRQVCPDLQNEGLWYSLVRFYNTEGIKGLFKGNGVNVIRIAPYNAIQLTSFHKYKELFVADKDPSRIVAASSFAGMTSVLSFYPLDLVRSVITIQTNDTDHYRTMIGTTKHILQTRGVKGLYQGLSASMIGIVPYVGVNLSLFEILKYRFQPRGCHPCFDVYNFGLGAIASTISVATTYPFESTRRKLQLSGISGTKRYEGIIDCISQTWKNSGPKGFYRGFVPCCLRVTPAMSIVMLINERFKHWLKF